MWTATGNTYTKLHWKRNISVEETMKKKQFPRRKNRKLVNQMTTK